MATTNQRPLVVKINLGRFFPSLVAAKKIYFETINKEKRRPSLLF